MHFSKTYTQLLLTLPPDLRESAIQYRQLKKIINQIVAELTSLGLSPDLLHGIIHQPPSQGLDKGKQRERSLTDFPSPQASSEPPLHSSSPRVIYELADVVDHVEPRLHLYLDNYGNQETILPPDVLSQALGFTTSCPTPLPSHQYAASSSSTVPSDSLASSDIGDHLTTKGFSNVPQELIIPLVSDTVFFRTLSEALESLSAYLVTRKAEFEATLQALSHEISSASHPSSSTSAFHPYSPFSSDPATINVSSGTLVTQSKSDLETWREIFRMYVEADIFQGHQERFRGERDTDDAAARFFAFSSQLHERLSEGDLKLKLKRSKIALRTFLELNTFILNLRKFQDVTAEATRKILKKHAKRTALPLAPDLASPFIIVPEARDRALVLSRPVSRGASSLSLSLLLVQALTETLLPIIPHIDDYSCVICTSLAFKPIRLRCSHLFCVRCLVKLQKRGEQHCPMCRAPTVLSADRSNVDWALLNFMKDWFPSEARKKLQQNEREAAEEELRELGLEFRGCIVV
ncbi:SPX domain-containing protein [Dichomitus squalens]|uniref:SPX domain-containing protein n=1 Tax=Dichomitus squalens TaxID=114155 RepID=A0A4Q9M6Z6_9APHY|nr:SPX domain-containing protein [Dichomitus squalens]